MPRSSRRTTRVVELLRDAGVAESRARSSCRHRSGDHGRDPGAGRRADGAPVRPLRRRARRRRGAVDVAAVRGDRARRRDLRPRRGRHEVEHPRPRRRAARVGGQAARRGQDPDRGSGGGRQPARGRVPVASTPSTSAADAILVADGGSIRAGQPSLTVSPARRRARSPSRCGRSRATSTPASTAARPPTR